MKQMRSVRLSGEQIAALINATRWARDYNDALTEEECEALDLARELLSAALGNINFERNRNGESPISTQRPIMKSAMRVEAEKEVLRGALKEMYACLNNRILGTGANPSENLSFRDQCIAACEAARAALRVTTLENPR